MSSDKLILLHTDEGKRLLQEAEKGKYHQPIMSSIFCKQVGHSNCGILSSALVLGANHINVNYGIIQDVSQKMKDDLPFTETKMYSLKQTTDVTPLEHNGTTLDQVFRILQGFDCKVQKYHASESSVDEFRRIAKDVLTHKDSSWGIIVNYHMGSLGQGAVYGHHSPLGAYHKATDRFLIEDTWYETKEPWAKTEDLFAAMIEIDTDSQKSRGFCVVQFPRN